MSQAMASLDSLQVGQSYGYLLRQTACPALEIRLSTPKTPESEMEMTTPAWAMAEARGILLSCATALSGTEEMPPSADPVKVLELLFSPTALPSVDWARWDGNFDWQDNPFQPAIDSLNSWPTPGWPAADGTHTLEIHSGDHWQLWHVEVQNDQFDFHLILENI
ncbi:MAG: hypothetical protein GY780_11700 [bacterium]|nr:hypothetical protein [bacterium]